MLDTQKVLYSHVWIGEGRATLAIRHLDDTTMEVGVAFCSPKDQYMRKQGRALALDHLNTKKYYFKVAKIAGSKPKVTAYRGLASLVLRDATSALGLTDISVADMAFEKTPKWASRWDTIDSVNFSGRGPFYVRLYSQPPPWRKRYETI